MSPANDSPCPNCGSPLPGDAPRGLCPKCLALQAEPPGSSDSDPTITPGADEAAGMARGPNALVTLRYFGDYELLEEIARGGMGVVFKARQISLNRLVAVKMILGGALSGGDAIKRFRKEAEAVARLDHPNIVPIYEIGEYQGLQYFSMKLVEGASLAQRMRSFQKDSTAAARLMAKTARAVHYAHQRGVLHRDLKPGNILLDGKDEPHLTDFGLAKSVEEPSDLTASGAILGTPNYMAPEQARGDVKQIATSADLFSMGAIFYEMLTGRPPFQAATPLEVLRKVVEQEAQPPSSVNVRVDRDLETICLKCLEKDPKNRYGSADALADDLERWLRHEPVLARRSSQIERLAKWVRRKPAVAALTGAVALAAMAGLAGVFWQWNQAVAARQVAARRAEESTERLVQLNVANGVRLMEEGDLFGSLPWFAEALKVNPGGALAEEMHRTRLGAILNSTPRLTRMFYGSNGVSWTEFSLKGDRLVIAEEDGAVQVWDTRSWERQGPAIRLTNRVIRALFRPDGGALAIVIGDSVVRVYSTSNNEMLVGLPHETNVIRAAWSGDGQRLMTLTANRSVQVWDLRTQQMVGPPVRHSGEVPLFAISPDGRRVATALRRDPVIRVWDTATGIVALALTHENGTYYATFSPDGKQIATTRWDGIAQVWDATSGKPSTPPMRHNDLVYSVVFSPDRRRLATTDNSGAARVWDAATGQAITPPLLHDGPVLQAAFSPDGRWVATASADRTARIWEASNGRRVASPLRHSGYVYNVSFSGNGHQLVTRDSDGVGRIWDWSGAIPAGIPLPHTNDLEHVEFSSDGTKLVTTSPGHSFRVWDALSGKAICGPVIFCTNTPGGGPVRETRAVISAYAKYQAGRALFSPDGKRLLTIGPDLAVRVWDASSGRPVGPALGHPTNLISAVFSLDARQVLTTSFDHAARIWDAESGRQIGSPLQHDRMIYFAAFSPDARFVATTSTNRTARVWKSESGEPISPPLPHQGEVFHAQFSPDGRRLITAATDDIYVWPLPSGVPKKLGLKSGAFRVAFSADGRRFVSANRSHDARVWDSSTLQPISLPMRNNADLIHVSFSADSGRILTLDSQESVRIWEAATGHPLTPVLGKNTDARLHAHAAEVSWFQGTLTPEMKRVLVAFRQRRPAVWNLEPTLWPPEDLAALANLLAVNQLHSSGGYVPVERSDLMQLWQLLTNRHAEFFAPAQSQRVVEWHRHAADESTREGDWFAAVFHLERLLTAAPEDPSLARQRRTAEEKLAAQGAIQRNH